MAPVTTGEKLLQKTQGRLQRKLAAYFPAEDVEWVPVATKDSDTGSQCLPFAYINARAIMDRLDAVMGIENWTTTYMPLGNGAVMCTLSLRLGGDWVGKSDVGGESDQKDAGDRTKAAYSDSLKRVAVQWGIGRYLSKMPKLWVAYDKQKKKIITKPTIPNYLLPSQLPDDGQELRVRLIKKELDLVEKHLCKGGELMAFVMKIGQEAQIPNASDMALWGEDGITLAWQAVKTFVASLKPTSTTKAAS